MRDDHARLIELERRQRKLAADMASLRQDARNVAQKTKSATSSPGTTVVIGGTGSNVIHWAHEFCFQVIFDTEPTLDTGVSLNPTLDAASLADAITALETSTAVPAYVIVDGGLGDDYAYWHSGHSIFREADSRPWQLFQTSGSYSPSASESWYSTHIHEMGWAFGCGWFPESGSLIENDGIGSDSGTQDIAGKFVPCVGRRYVGASQLVSWDAWSPVHSEYTPDFRGNIKTSFLYPSTPILDGSYVWLRLTKWVRFRKYAASGDPLGYWILAYHRNLFDDGEVVAPYAFTEGPKYGTTGSYQFDAFGMQYYGNGDDPEVENVLLDSLGVADVKVIWGASCDTPEPPVTSEPEDWSDFCAALAAASSTWNPIAGLTISFDGTDITTDSLGTYADPPIIAFSFSDRLAEYLAANTDVYLTYEWSARCTNTPFSPITETGVISNGMAFATPHNTTCDGRPEQTEAQLVVRMRAYPSRYMFEDECCSPFSTSCSVSELLINYVSYTVDPP